MLRTASWNQRSSGGFPRILYIPMVVEEVPPAGVPDGAIDYKHVLGQLEKVKAAMDMSLASADRVCRNLDARG